MTEENETMGAIWGDPIAVDGKRPAWLAAGTHGEYQSGGCVECWHTRFWNSASWNGIVRIRLPADHFAYKAIAAGFEPWGGGEAAPKDWDEGEVLLRAGCTGGGFRWTHGTRPSSPGRDIIGYHKRAVPTQEAEPVRASEPGTDAEVDAMCRAETDEWLSRRMAAMLPPAAGPTVRVRRSPFPDSETVTIRRVAESESWAWALRIAKDGTGRDGPATAAGAHAALKALNLIRPDTPAERCAAALGISPDLAARVIAWIDATAK